MSSLVYDFRHPGDPRRPSRTIAHARASRLSIATRPWPNAVGPAPEDEGGGGGLGAYGHSVWSFTLEPQAGHGLDISGFSLEQRAGGPCGPRRFEVCTSVDGFQRPILSSAVGLPEDGYVRHAVALDLRALVQPFVLRIVASEAMAFEPSGWFLRRIALAVRAPVLARAAGTGRPARPAELAL